MKNNQRRCAQKMLPLLLAMYGGSALAFEQIKFDDGTVLDISAQVSYVNAKRLNGVDPMLLKQPFSISIPSSGTVPDKLRGLTNQLLQQLTDNQQRGNSDDGDRSIGKHGTISNKISALFDINLTKDNYRAFARVSTFKDTVYDHTNGNTTPAYVAPVSGLGGLSQASANGAATFNGTGPSNQYSQDAKDLLGQRTRLLDAYLQGQWRLSDGSSGTSNPLTIKVGRQVVAWGEGLIFQGIGGSMNPSDAVKGQMPGTPLKEIFLPSEQIYGSLGLTEKLTGMAYYKWRFRPNELPPVGTYFSPADIVGPGANFLAAGDFMGAYCSLAGGYDLWKYRSPPPNGSGDSSATSSPWCPSKGMFGAGNEGEVGRKNSGQWGLGLRYEYTDATAFGAYFLRYTALVGLPEMTYPSGNSKDQVDLLGIDALYPYKIQGQSYGVDLMNNTWIPNGALPLLQTLIPQSYHIRYMNDIKLLGGSFTTKLGEYNVAGEIAYRDGEPIMMGHGIDNHYQLARGKVTNMQVSALKTWGSDFLDGAIGVSQVALAGEVAASHLNSFETPAYSGFTSGRVFPSTGNPLNIFTWLPQTFDGAPSTPPSPSGLRNSMAYAFDLMMDYTAIFPGWDLQNEVIWMHQLKGNSAMQNGWNSGLQGKNDRRLSLGMKFTYQNNLELGLKLIYFLGGADVDFVNMRTMVDRDMIAFTATYHF